MMARRLLAGCAAVALATITMPVRVEAQQPPPAARSDSSITTRGDSVSVRLVDVDLRAAAQALSRYLDRPLLFSAPTSARVTLETPRPVPRADVVRLLRGLVESQGLELVSDTAAGVWRVNTKAVGSPGTELEFAL